MNPGLTPEMGLRVLRKSCKFEHTQIFPQVNFKICILSTGLNYGIPNHESESVSYYIIKLLSTAETAGTHIFPGSFPRFKLSFVFPVRRLYSCVVQI